MNPPAPPREPLRAPSGRCLFCDPSRRGIDGNTATIGVTDFAQGELGDIVYVEIETIGEELAQHEIFGTVEAVKTVSDLFMPVSGKVTAKNDGIDANPQDVNTDPYGKGWIFRMRPFEKDANVLLNADQYSKQVASEAH